MLLRCTLFRGLRACSGCPTLFDLPCQSRTGIAALTRSYADLVPARQPSTKEATARDGKQRARFSLYSSTTGSFAQSRTWEELYAGHSEVLKSALHVLQQNQGDTEAQRGTEDGHSNQTTSQQTIHRKGADFFWLSVVDPTEEEVKGLCQNLDVHPLTIEDMLNLESRDKMETFSKYRFISYASFDGDSQSTTYLQPHNTYILLFPTAVISFHHRSSDHVTVVRQRLEGKRQAIKAGPQWVAYGLLDTITDQFRPAIESVEGKIEQIESSLSNMDHGNPMQLLKTIGANRGIATRLRRLVGEKSEVLQALRKRLEDRRAASSMILAPREIDLHLSDVHDHLHAATQELTHLEDVLSGAQGNCLMYIQVHAFDVNNRTNNALSKLTVLGTILVPLNVITGLWGMNVVVPGQHDETLFWFGLLSSSMACIALCSSLLARRFLRNEVKK